MDQDNTERNYRLPQFDRRKGDRRREDRRGPGRNRLSEFGARRDGPALDRRQVQRRHIDRRASRRGGLLEEVRNLISRRLVRWKLHGSDDEKVRELDTEIDDRRSELKARAEERKAAHDVSRDRSTSVES